VLFPTGAKSATFNLNVATNDRVLGGYRYIYFVITSASLPDGIVIGYPGQAAVIITGGNKLCLCCTIVILFL